MRHVYSIHPDPGSETSNDKTWTIFHERNILKQLAVFKVEIFSRALFPHRAWALVVSDVPSSQFCVQVQPGTCSLQGPSTAHPAGPVAMAEMSFLLPLVQQLCTQALPATAFPKGSVIWMKLKNNRLCDRNWIRWCVDLQKNSGILSKEPYFCQLIWLTWSLKVLMGMKRGAILAKTRSEW